MQLFPCFSSDLQILIPPIGIVSPLSFVVRFHSNNDDCMTRFASAPMRELAGLYEDNDRPFLLQVLLQIVPVARGIQHIDCG